MLLSGHLIIIFEYFERGFSFSGCKLVMEYNSQDSLSQDEMMMRSAMGQNNSFSGSGSLERNRLYYNDTNSTTESSSQSGVYNNPVVNTSLNNFSHIFKSKVFVSEKNLHSSSDPLVGQKRATSTGSDNMTAVGPNKKVDKQNLLAKYVDDINCGKYLDDYVGNDSVVLDNTSIMNYGKYKVDTNSVGRLQSDFDIIEEVGSGVFGKVYKVMGKIDRSMYAIKASRKGFNSENERQTMINEVHALAALSMKETNSLLDSDTSDDEDITQQCKRKRRRSSISGRGQNHIVRYYGNWIENDQLYIQMELCENSVENIFNAYLTSIGISHSTPIPIVMSRRRSASVASLDETLTDIVATESVSGTPVSTPPASKNMKLEYPFSMRDLLTITRDILLALEFLHRNDYVHLDIKPGNILIKNNHYKLSDFGLALRVDDSGWSKNASLVEEGDTRYMARELLDWGTKDLRKCDVYSLGASIYELSNGLPLPSEGSEWQGLRNDSYDSPKFPMNPSRLNTDEFKNELTLIISDLLRADPTQRHFPGDYIQKYRGLQSKIERKLLDSENTISLLTNQLNNNPNNIVNEPIPSQSNANSIESSAQNMESNVANLNTQVVHENALNDSSCIPKASSRHRLKRSHTVQ